MKSAAEHPGKTARSGLNRWTRGDTAVFVILTVIALLILLPFYNAVVISLETNRAYALHPVSLYPAEFSLKNYTYLIEKGQIWTGFQNTVLITAIGTVLSMSVSVMMAYAFSRRQYPGKRLFFLLMMFTMFFSGGMIPTFIVVTRFLHLYNSRWSVVLSSLTTAWYIMVARSFFASIPDEIVESARIDGASEFRTFLQIMMPVSKPILAVLALYFAVAHWNSYFSAMLYISDKNLQPLALYIRSVVLQNSMANFADTSARITAAQILSNLQIKYAVIVISVLPMMCVYPFISGNLEKGLMIGSITG